MSFLWQSNKTGRPSASKTLWVVMGIVCVFRFATAGITLWGIDFPEFDWVGAAALFAIFTAGYAKREQDHVN